MRAALLLVLLAGCSEEDPEDELLESLQQSTTTTAPDEEGIQASAMFTVTLGRTSGDYEYRQSELVASTLDGSSAVPVQLHASDEADPLRELSLSGAPEVGKDKPTSPSLALALNVVLDGAVVALNSLSGECLVTVSELDPTSIAGSFTCASTYAEDDLTAEGTFRAS